MTPHTNHRSGQPIAVFACAEMKLPGRAWLEFEVVRHESGNTTIHQTAVFDPAGLFGLLYWYGI